MAFREKTVWITGASSGIGEALAYAFAGKGARLVLSARNADALERVAACCLAKGAVEKPLLLPFDLAAHNIIPAMARQALGWRGGIDILVNNAGIGQRATAAEIKPEIARRIMEVNFFAPVFLTREVLPAMLARKSGRIVVVSSVLGKFHLPGRSVYTASKHALQGYFDTLRAELSGSGVGVTIICPGWIDTRISENALTGDGGCYGKATRSDARKMSAEECARKMIAAIAAGRREALIGGSEIWGGVLRAALPDIFDWLVNRQAREFLLRNR